MHQDKDENDFNHPILSISLGSDAIFLYGKDRKKLKKIRLKSGSVVKMHGKSRLFFHGISRIIKVDFNILSNDIINFPHNARINVTLRRFRPNN